jgi:hypothetical protein
MAAQLLGTTGNWGILQDQAGILITDQSFDFSNQEKPVLSDFGFRISDFGFRIRGFWIAEIRGTS